MSTTKLNVCQNPSQNAFSDVDRVDTFGRRMITLRSWSKLERCAAAQMCTKSSVKTRRAIWHVSFLAPATRSENWTDQKKQRVQRLPQNLTSNTTPKQSLLQLLRSMTPWNVKTCLNFQPKSRAPKDWAPANKCMHGNNHHIPKHSRGDTFYIQQASSAVHNNSTPKSRKSRNNDKYCHGFITMQSKMYPARRICHQEWRFTTCSRKTWDMPPEKALISRQT